MSSPPRSQLLNREIPKRSATKNSLARMLATWFGCGDIPVAPGTVGSLGAIAPVWALAKVAPLNGWMIAAAGAALFAPGVWAADVTAAETGLKDPRIVVIDEVVGQWITMAGAQRLNWKSLAFGFVLFRAFDIWKPFPARQSEQLRGGLGIVADDAISGVYAALVLSALGWLNFY